MPRTDDHIIYDVGMHIGDDTAYYLSKGRRVVAIEANPVMAHAGRQRFAEHLARGQLEILNVGISRSNGVAHFWICDSHPAWSSFDRAIASRNGATCHSVEIPTMRFNNVLDKYGIPHYLKINIVGNDLLCVDDLPPSSLPQYLSFESECLDDKDRQTAQHGLQGLRKLRDLGYRQFKLISQSSFSSLAVPANVDQRLDSIARWCQRLNIPGSYRLFERFTQRARLAKKVGWQFADGSSGPWGEDTPGKWLDFDQAARAYEFHRALHFANPGVPTYSFWCDWHAKAQLD